MTRWRLVTPVGGGYCYVGHRRAPSGYWKPHYQWRKP